MTSDPMPTRLSAFISLEDLAATLGVTKPTIGAWRRERQLPAIRLCTRTYFHLPSVAAWLKAQEAVEIPGAPEQGRSVTS
jgi:DNA-binding XRE family transcriptional regulator